MHNQIMTRRYGNRKSNFSLKPQCFITLSTLWNVIHGRIDFMSFQHDDTWIALNCFLHHGTWKFRFFLAYTFEISETIKAHYYDGNNIDYSVIKQ